MFSQSFPTLAACVTLTRARGHTESERFRFCVRPGARRQRPAWLQAPTSWFLPARVRGARAAEEKRAAWTRPAPTAAGVAASACRDRAVPVQPQLPEAPHERGGEREAGRQPVRGRTNLSERGTESLYWPRGSDHTDAPQHIGHVGLTIAGRTRATFSRGLMGRRMAPVDWPFFLSI